MVTWLYHCVKRLLSTSSYAEICCIVDHSKYPCEDNSKHGLYLRFSLFTSDPFSPPHIRVSCRWSFSGSIFCLFIYGKASLAMEGMSVVPMEITFIDNGGKYNLYNEFTEVNSHIGSRLMNSQMWIHIYEVVEKNSHTRIHMISILWFRIGFWFLPWACLISLSQKSWEGALAKYIADDRTLTRQNCNINFNTTF